MPKTFDPSDYCPVCENRGFTHGACIICKREPAFQVTRIGDEHLVTRSAKKAPAPPPIPTELDPADWDYWKGITFDRNLWRITSSLLCGHHVYYLCPKTGPEPENWQKWCVLPNVDEVNQFATYDAAWQGRSSVSGLLDVFHVADCWDMPMVSCFADRWYGSIEPGHGFGIINNDQFLFLRGYRSRAVGDAAVDAFSALQNHCRHPDSIPGLKI